MNSEKIGKLISKLRKEKSLTQKQLADILGVSPKTISKWECGSGLPDISIIKKIADELNITVEELLDGDKKTYQEGNRNKPIKKKNILLMLLLALIIITLSLLLVVKLSKHSIDNNIDNQTSSCTVIRTYHIDNISPSNDENYLYITIHEFQVEGTFTIKLPKVESDKLQTGNNYEFTFKTSKENVITTTDILFKNSEIIDIEYSDKVGLETASKYTCD